MNIFISGGCKNGKSFEAQRISKRLSELYNSPLYYVATMKSVDSEDDERIQRHRIERQGWGFETIEQQNNIAEIACKADLTGVFLVDSVTALLANEMFGSDGSVNNEAGETIVEGFDGLLKDIGHTVIVSDYIYSDAEVYDSITEKYRKTLAWIDIQLAKRCDVVLESAFGFITVHKGEASYASVV